MQATSLGQITSWLAALETARFEPPRPAPFLKPFHLVLLAQAIRRWELSDGNLPLTEDQIRYACRMGLWEVTDGVPPVAVGKNPANGRFAPLIALRHGRAVDDAAKELAAVCVNAKLPPKWGEDLFTPLHELLENARAHAEVKIGPEAFACAQNWANGGLMQVALVDSGIGIRESLSRDPRWGERLASGNACALATELEVTSKAGRGHSGYGLAVTRQVAEWNRGLLTVASGNEYFRVFDGKAQCGLSDTFFRGTLVVLELKTNRPLQLREIYDSWGNHGDDFGI